jgi:uncharacterized repeat protein (TIGR01451 family)
MINASVNRSAGSYILSYQLALYNKSSQTFLTVGFENLPNFFVTITWTDLNGNSIHSLTVNAKVNQSYGVTLTRTNFFTISAVGDNENFHFRLGGESYLGDVNLTISKTANATIITKGDTLIYTITVTNHGRYDGYNVVVNEFMPSYLVIIASNHTQGSYDIRTGLWEIGNLNSSQSARLTITVLVNRTGAICNNVSVSTDNRDFGNRFANFTVMSKIQSNSSIISPKAQVGKAIRISGVVTDSEGNPVSNVKITVKINGKSYSVNTNKDGIWVLSYTPTQDGKLAISVSWLGSEHHFGFINTTTINVEKSNDSDDDSDDNNDQDKDANVAMKKTGIPIIIIMILAILTTFSISVFRKEK